MEFFQTLLKVGRVFVVGSKDGDVSAVSPVAENYSRLLEQEVESYTPTVVHVFYMHCILWC
jgi:hypothetical protein